LANNRRLNNFEIFGLVFYGIAIALIVFVGPLSTPAAESMTFSSSPHLGKSSTVDGLSSTQIGESSGSNIGTNVGARSSGSNNKVIMINFDDSYKTQVLYAKPILDQYGFKATFFEVCGWVGKTSERQSWQDVAALQNDGMDIESHNDSCSPKLSITQQIEL